MYLLIILGPIITLICISLILNLIPRFISIAIVLFSLFLSLIFCVFIVYEVVYLNSFCLIELNTWFKLGVLNVKWSFYFDKLSTLMIFLIIFISLLVHFFALDYLSNDPHLPRFLMLLSLFTIFMEILVTSGNIIQFFLGWEGVGLMSYLLINFWFTRYAASNSGLMAIIYNRIGDSEYF
jgi:NADH-ubiquinone oxidoreductase chain 5